MHRAQAEINKSGCIATNTWCKYSHLGTISKANPNSFWYLRWEEKMNVSRVQAAMKHPPMGWATGLPGSQIIQCLSRIQTMKEENLFLWSFAHFWIKKAEIFSGTFKATDFVCIYIIQHYSCYEGEHRIFTIMQVTELCNFPAWLKKPQFFAPTSLKDEIRGKKSCLMKRNWKKWSKHHCWFDSYKSSVVISGGGSCGIK